MQEPYPLAEECRFNNETPCPWREPFPLPITFPLPLSALSSSLEAIRVHLGVKSISPSWQHANESCCKRRPPSRMRDPRDRTDNTRESTMPVSSAFLVCQAHVKARLREPLPYFSSLSLSLSLSPFPFSVSLLPSSWPFHIFLSLSPSLFLFRFSFSRPLSRCRYNRDGYKRYRRSKGLQWI